MMDPVIKAQWVEALRSGKYKQGKGALECNGKNCCLGVLARIVGIPSSTTRSRRGDHEEIVYFHFEKWASGTGFVDREKWGLSLMQTGVLVQKNDDLGNTFAEIADYIESSTEI